VGQASNALPEVAYYYPEPYWREGDWIKTLLLFFDGVAILLPSYMRGRPAAVDPVMVEPLEDRGLLHILEPETFVDQEVTEQLIAIMVNLVTEGAFDDLDEPAFTYAELSRSRLGWNADIELSEMLIEELKPRKLARDSEDGFSVPLHPTVRTTVLVLLSQLARVAGRKRGLELHPATDRADAVDSLVETLTLPAMPSAGHVVALDLEQVTMDLSAVSLDEVLDFRAEHGAEHRGYMRNLRQFVLQLSALHEEERQVALLDRREELADEADRLRRLARKTWKRPLVGFGLGAVGAAWTAQFGGLPGVLLSLAAGVAGGLADAAPTNAYSYLFSVQRAIGARS